VIEEYLRVCGYNAEDIVLTKKQEKKLWEMEVEEYNDNDYMEIENLTHEEFDMVDLLIKKGEAEKIHKQQRKKYEFDHYILRDNKDLIDIKTRAGMFDVYVKNTSKIQATKNNAFIERSFSANGELHKYDIPSIYINNTKDKVARVAHLMKLLGVDRSYDTATITRENIKATGEYIQANLDQLKTEWGLDFRYHTTKDADDDSRYKETAGNLNQILGKWGFQEIKRGGRKRKVNKKTGIREEVAGFELGPKSKYAGFDKHCLCKTNWELHEPLFEVDDDF